MKASVRIDFWLDLASTYSYLTACRIAGSAEASGVRVRWRPVVLGTIFRDSGWASSPFNIYPAKGAHMWRDMERRAAAYGVEMRRPPVFPRNSLLAHRVMLAGLGQGWGERFALEVFQAEFVRGEDIGDTAVLAPCVAAAGGDPAAALESANLPAVKDALRRETEAAVAAGVFGAPSFVVGSELFWGDDRLEDALSWALGRHRLQGRNGSSHGNAA